MGEHTEAIKSSSHGHWGRNLIDASAPWISTKNSQHCCWNNSSPWPWCLCLTKTDGSSALLRELIMTRYINGFYVNSSHKAPFQCNWTIKKIWEIKVRVQGVYSCSVSYYSCLLYAFISSNLKLKGLNYKRHSS